MAIIAVAGGTSPSLGHSIVTAIGASSNQPIILSRIDPPKPQPSHCYGAEVRYVDYTSHASLVLALRGVETVISVIKIPGPEWASYQINLLNAAREAGCKRFAPSQFENGPLAADKVDITGLKLAVWQACKESGLEVARFSCGMFMNYLALGSEDLKEGRKEEALHGLVDEPIIWDVKNRTAELPVKDDGTSPRFTTTEIGDVGKFVAAVCELELGKWEQEMMMVGETIEVDKATELLGKAIRAPFEIRKVGRKELQSRDQSVEGIGKSREEIVLKLISQIELVMLDENEGAAILKPVINQLCPAVKPLNVTEYLDKVYG
ncbi:hypothetical protein ACLMJK_000364 [Lecanora helva]